MTRILYAIMFAAILCLYGPVFAQTFVKIGASFTTAPNYAKLENGQLDADLPMPEEERALMLGEIEPGAGARAQPETTINPAPSGSGEKEKE